jgi:hypothetical protein
MQSKIENPESFNWFLKTLQEEQKKQGVSGEQPDTLDQSQIINILRFVKVFSPTIDKLMEFCKSELALSILTTTEVLDKLEKEGDIAIKAAPRPAETPSAPQITDRIVTITDEGLKKL